MNGENLTVKRTGMLKIRKSENKTEILENPPNPGLYRLLKRHPMTSDHS
jgi:hypothetical protein